MSVFSFTKACDESLFDDSLFFSIDWHLVDIWLIDSYDIVKLF